MVWTGYAFGKRRRTSEGFTLSKNGRALPGIRFLSKKTHSAARRHRARACLADRRGPPVGFLFFLPRTGGRTRGELPATIAGARSHLSQSCAHRHAQEGRPHPLEGKEIAGELGGEHPFLHGGRGFGHERGLGICWLSGETGRGNGLAGSRGSYW